MWGHRITSRNAEAIKFFALSQVALGAACLIATLNGIEPMPVATHGAATAAFTTQEWAAAVIAQGLLLWVAAHVRWTFGLVVAGAAGAAINGALACYAFGAEAGFIVSRGALLFALAHGAIGFIAAADLVAQSIRRLNHRGQE